MATRETAGRMSADDALELWREYRRTEDPRVRDRLVLTFAPMVKYIVYRKVREMPARCDLDDFISCGLEALIRSIDRYDPDKGATLEQFAWTRIHGAVLDELLKRQDELARAQIGSLNAVVQSDNDAAIERIDTLPADDRDSDPESLALAAKERFRKAFDCLAPRERKIAVLLYVYHLTLREIGEILGVTESRVCQLHAQILKTLRAQLKSDEQLLSCVA